jgi:hypothetical protein
MSLNFRGDRTKLKNCVSRSGSDGSWKKLTNKYRQFITRDRGILNWVPSTGRIWFQGEKKAAKELERKFIAVASAKGLIESESVTASVF